MKSLYYILIGLFICFFSLVSCAEKKDSTSIFSTISAAQYDSSKSYEIYNNIVKNFKIIDSQAIIDEIIEKPALIYFGRATCPQCQAFLPYLEEARKETKSTIYYLDTENTEENESIQKARGKYQIESVPSLVFVQKNGHYEKFDMTQLDQLANWITNKS